MANLEVQIGADSSEFNSEIAKVEKQLAALKSQQVSNIKLGIDNSSIDKQISDTTTKLNGLKSSVSSSASAFNNHSKATLNGGNTLMQFSRIAQDAPFGIIGIGNNLTATAESFSHLSRTAGGAGGALKAVASSLMGTGGILLAVSLVTTALTVMSQQGLTIGDVFNKLSGNFDAFGNTLKTVSQEATKSAIEEAGALKGLIAIAQDERQSKKLRFEAVEQLQKQYPNYFGNLSKEEIMYGNLTGVVNDVTKALINKAIAEKMSEKAAEPTMKLWEANARLIKQREEAAKAEKKMQEAAKNPEMIQSMRFYADASARATQRLQETRNEVIALNKEVAKYDKVITMASQKASKVILKPGGTKAQKQTPASALDAQVRTNPAIDNNMTSAGLVDTSAQGAELQATKLSDIASQITASRNIVSSETVAMAQALYDFNENASAIIGGSISNTFGALGEGIGSALASGGNVLTAAGDALLAGLGSILVELGKMAIQTGVGILAVKMALKSLNPYVAIAAGIGLVALGSMFSSKSKSLGVSMGSTGGSGGSSGGGSGNIQTGASVMSPTSSVSGGGAVSNGGGTVVFEIAGQKLIGVLNNTLGANQRLGGSLALGN